MEDIVPKLLEAIRDDFKKILGEAKVKELNYPAAEDFAEKVGAALAEAFHRNLDPAQLPEGKMFWNIADRVVRPMLEQDHKIVSDAAVAVQEALNKAAGIGLKAQRAPLDQDRVSGILNKIASADHFSDVAWVLDEPVKTFSRSVVDDTIRENAEFHSRAGLHPRIIRTAEHKCCEWCSRLAGVYDYPNIPREVYQRHNRCRCTVDYNPGDGKKLQNAHTKRWGNNPQDKELMSARQQNEAQRISKFIDENYIEERSQCLPNLEKAEIPSSKLSGYALNMNHPTGRSKAIAFRDALGYTISNEEELKEAIRSGLNKWKANARPRTQHGQPYEVKMLITGANGKVATVKTAWQIDNGKDTPRLVSVYVYR